MFSLILILKRQCRHFKHRSQLLRSLDRVDGRVYDRDRKFDEIDPLRNIKICIYKVNVFMFTLRWAEEEVA